MKKQPHVTEQTRRKLINAFWELYKTEDISKITVGNICKVADYERTSFYRYFMDINDILNQLENEIINNIKDSINASNKSGKFSNFKNFTNHYGEYFTVFHEKGNRSFYDKFKELVKSDVYKYLKLDVKDENRKDYIFEFVFASLLGSYAYWYRHQDMMDLESLSKFANNTLLNGTNSIINKKEKN